MNIFSNLGITEIVVILLLALLVVGPERLPEFGKKLGKTLKDVRKAYDNLTRDLGPEFSSLQESTRDLQESMNAVRTIPQDMVQTMVEATDMDDTISDLKGVADDVGQVTQTMATAGSFVKNPVDSAVKSARDALKPPEPAAAEDPTGAERGTQEPVESDIAAEETTPEMQEPVELAIAAEDTAPQTPEPAELAIAAEETPPETAPASTPEVTEQVEAGSGTSD